MTQPTDPTKPTGMTGQPPPTPLLRRRPGRKRTRPLTGDAALLNLPPIRPMRQLTLNWRTRRAIRQKRLGEWAAMTRARMGLTFREVEALAVEDGERLSTRQMQRIEQMSQGAPDPAQARDIISLPAIDWLATISGQSLADVERYLRSGDVRDLAPDTEANVHTLRAVFLALSPARQRAVLDLAQYLYMLDEAEQGAQQGAPGVSGIQNVTPFTAPLPPTMPPSMPPSVPTRPTPAEEEVLRVRAELQRAYERIEAQERAETRENDRQNGEQDDRRGDRRDDRRDEGHDGKGRRTPRRTS